MIEEVLVHWPIRNHFHSLTPTHIFAVCIPSSASIGGYYTGLFAANMMRPIIAFNTVFDSC